MKNHHRRLTLHRQTLRVLTGAQLANAQGGGTADNTAFCPNTKVCPPPPLPTLQTCPTAKGVC